MRNIRSRSRIAVVLGAAASLLGPAIARAQATPPPCSEVAANGEGYGDPFIDQRTFYRKITPNWGSNDGREFWCKTPEAAWFEHRGQRLFLTGVNIGNVNVLPFSQAPYEHSEAELKAMFRAAFADLAAQGVNSIRFWVHIDGSVSPTFGPGGPNALVTGLPPGFLDDLRWLIDTAYGEYGLLVNLNLWSHDILAVRRLNPIENRERAIRMFTDPVATNAYIDHALTPMIEALRAPMRTVPNERYLDGVLSVEVLNEPEGVSWHWRLYHNYQYRMAYGGYRWKEQLRWLLGDPSRSERAHPTGLGGTEAVQYHGWHFISGGDSAFNSYMYKDVFDDYPSEWDVLKRWIVDDRALTTREIPHHDVLAFINRVAGAIHRLEPSIQVSSGAHSMPYNTDVPMPGLEYENAPYNYYSDTALIAAGGDPLGTLDFYQVHGYPEWSDSAKNALLSMFEHPKQHWRIAKPLVVGEHWSMVRPNNAPMDARDYEHLYDTGYAGGWGWAYFYPRERWDAASGTWKRSIDAHENQAPFRRLFQSLPARLKFPTARAAALQGNHSGVGR